jgi:tetratricopeptide (TPR) repeat protein
MVANIRGIVAVNIYLNRLDEAVASVQAAYARNLDDVSLHALLFQIAFLRRDTATLEREMAWGMGKPGAEDIFLDAQADLQEAVRKTDTAMALAPNQVTEFLAALTLARAGKRARATAIVNQLDHDYPTSTNLQFYWLPSIRASIQVNNGDGTGAIQSLQATVPHELGAARPFVAIYPVYIRGQAFLLAHQAPAAAAKFQRVLNHRTLTTFVTASLAQLQLARAYAISGETRKAKAAYEEFFALWKDADPDVPIVKLAKAEYANLMPCT